VKVAAEDVLPGELHRVTAGECHPRRGGQLSGDLHRGVAGTNHHDSLSGEGRGAAVLGGVEHRTGES